MKEPRIKILCVDDEPAVLAALGLHLQRRYEMISAHSGADGLLALDQHRDVTVVMSDMRMPKMNGAQFLARVRELVPDATRLLLTGYADLDSAISAINDGHVFRMMTKPIQSSALLGAFEDAIAHHRLITSERVLLEQTLQGSIKALIDVLAIVNPISFGRAARIKQLVREIADALAIKERWQLEMAAMLCQLGSITLPPEVVEKLYYGQPLNDAERAMCSKVPAVTEQLLGSIPRLEGVRGILAAWPHPFRPKAETDAAKQFIRHCAHILRVAVDFDVLEAQGLSAIMAIDTLRGRDGYDPAIVEALAATRGATTHVDIRELSLSGLRVGMVFADDVKMLSGTLLVARGTEVTQSFIERVRNFPPNSVQDRIRVVLV